MFDGRFCKYDGKGDGRRWERGTSVTKTCSGSGECRGVTENVLSEYVLEGCEREAVGVGVTWLGSLGEALVRWVTFWIWYTPLKLTSAPRKRFAVTELAKFI